MKRLDANAVWCSVWGVDSFLLGREVLTLEKRGGHSRKTDDAHDLKGSVQSVPAANGVTASENEQLASFLSWQMLKPQIVVHQGLPGTLLLPLLPKQGRLPLVTLLLQESTALSLTCRVYWLLFCCNDKTPGLRELTEGVYLD